MNVFLRKMLFFIFLPLLILLSIELLSSPTLFTFRSYEGIIFSTNVSHLGHFYPNMKINKNSEGDLCHNTKFSIIKKESWLTDSIGFRNKKFIKKPDVIFIGSSFFYGTGLTQGDIISNQVSTKLKNKFKVYNMSPATLGEFDYYLRSRIIKKPKLIVFSIGEIHAPIGFIPFKNTSDNYFKKKIKNIMCSGLNTYIDRSMRFYSLNWLKSRVNSIQNFGIKSPKTNMFFGQGLDAKVLSSLDLNNTLAALKSCKKYCDSLGVKLLIVPTPNKETIYFNLVPLKKQPDFFYKLYEITEKSSISMINTVDVFNKYNKKSKKLIYHLDDTHWNSLGVSIISDEIVKYIDAHKLLFK